MAIYMKFEFDTLWRIFNSHVISPSPLHSVRALRNCDVTPLRRLQAEVLEQLVAGADPAHPPTLVPGLILEHRHLCKIVNGFLTVTASPDTALALLKNTSCAWFKRVHTKNTYTHWHAISNRPLTSPQSYSNVI